MNLQSNPKVVDNRWIAQNEKGNKKALDQHVNVMDLNQELIIEQEEKKRYEGRLDRLESKLSEVSSKEFEKKMELFKEIQGLKEAIAEKDRSLFLLNKSKRIIEASILQMNQLEKKVFYAHRYLGKSLVEIADELNHDYGYIRTVSARADKKMR
ncbi:RNA polymerase sigma factor sigma-70 region 4 domain-containing protein [Acetobacterium woodii]|uniref:Uncharacterized protein n=1 Tax=Acetobacterium woodii (strain ATCC 29683 / DSM 1030 / JCM 2381 / KCTC 1655 / WB1) TaxID=931626 RepID=H6LJQ1_ACEWD|nr:hypothetical protein [Acetobacterium woodii]AFA47452.1 hypothetical protein Awo_c06580 [Acetobacterium woodii DSM 1030]